jgi:alkanesulfonate monooxygenase SsuD/methylene tetrahydromethanopterin reductase-like flavin-dependent oxidoreductase (luciferase family)
MATLARRMKIGLAIPLLEGRLDGHTPKWNQILALSQLAEDVGFDSLWLADHFLFRFGGKFGLKWQVGSWDCWSILSALAAATTRIELGTLVTCATFRNPALLAKMADSVDDISGGRLILGLGAGYHEPEYRALGLPYDHRVSRFEEAITIISTLLREGKIDFQGSYYSARECELRPRGPRPGGPLLLVGSTSPRMLRLTARLADLWNGWLVFGRSDPREVPPLRALVDAACHEVGRQPQTLGRTLAVLVAPSGKLTASSHLQGLLLRGIGIVPEPLAGSPEDIAGALRSFADEGITHLQINLTLTSLAEVEAFGAVLQALDRVDIACATPTPFAASK